MTVRYRAGDPFGVPSGYESSAVPEDFVLPPCGVEDVDRAFFKTLKDDVAFQVGSDPGKQQRVPLVFAVGEKWSMLKSGRALRDKTGALILPLITVRRTGLEQGSNDVGGRGTNQHTGQIVVRTRLDPSDRAYQNVVNKLGLANSDDVAGERDPASDGALSTERAGVKQNSLDLDVLDGALLAPKLGRNAWQIVSIPAPQFFTATYEITFWAQYTEHMNQILEQLMSAYLPTGNRCMRLDTDKGYWFVAYFDEAYSSEDNSDNTAGIELIRKFKLTAKVPGYILVSSAPGVPNGIRKYVSAPNIEFTFAGGESGDTTLVEGEPTSRDPYEAADDPERAFLLTDPSQHPSVKREIVPSRAVVDLVANPFFGGRREPRYARVVRRDPSTGETTLVASDGLELQIVSKK